MTPTPVDATARRRSALPRRTAMQLAAAEYRRMTEALAALDDTEWSRPTDCSAWDVRQLGCHMVGMAAMISTPLETMRQQKKAARISGATGVTPLDALTGLQVDERSAWSPADVIRGAEKIAAKAARGRRMTPSFIRARALPEPQSVNGRDEQWSIGFLVDTILTRDPWMHRMDLARATDRDPDLTPEHDGAIVADVVAEWAGRHGEPFDLELTGPAGGHWHNGSLGESISMDAVAFCRVVSGRGSGDGLLQCQVPF